MAPAMPEEFCTTSPLENALTTRTEGDLLATEYLLTADLIFSPTLVTFFLYRSSRPVIAQKVPIMRL